MRAVPVVSLLTWRAVPVVSLLTRESGVSGTGCFAIDT